MEKGINHRIYEFEKDIFEVINKAKLPPRVCGLIFESYANQMSMAHTQAATSERVSYEESDKDGEKIHKA